ncbi:MAG: type II toxin-antitoxin system YafQ family toxin [Bacilli bacterium]|nr:type II toxin-antitoxin system YafQ family toxin [Bacilli bacterium]
MIDLNTNTKYRIDFSKKFKKQLRKIISQDKNIDELLSVVTKLANKEKLDIKYRDHQLIDDKTYKNCRECHIKPDWLLIYKYEEENLVLVLFATGSHNVLFNK